MQTALMREISDEFLLGVGGMSATLVGLFLVGAFFYAETALRDPAPGRAAMAPYIRASARIVLILYAIPIGLSLSLVALELFWSRLLFIVLSLLLLAANVDTVRRLMALSRPSELPLLVGTEVIGTAFVVVLVRLPWILGGLYPDRADLTWSALISFATGFLGIAAMVLTAFDVTEGRAGTVDSAPDQQSGKAAVTEATGAAAEAAKRRRPRQSSVKAPNRH
jgi:uncharacterized membrane protein YhaH (DUF805 family)